MSFHPRFGRMLRHDEVMYGVKVADWQPPPQWGEPFKLPPRVHQGVLIEELLFGHRSIARVYQPDTPDPDLPTTPDKDHDHVCD